VPSCRRGQPDHRPDDKMIRWWFYSNRITVSKTGSGLFGSRSRKTMRACCDVLGSRRLSLLIFRSKSDFEPPMNSHASVARRPTRPKAALVTPCDARHDSLAFLGLLLYGVRSCCRGCLRLLQAPAAYRYMDRPVRSCLVAVCHRGILALEAVA
jgi:hypothetical protein